MSKANDVRRKWHGSKWIRVERRLGIYIRDGMACVWCGATVEDQQTILSLDHVIPDVKGGTHESSNLVTACKRCNSARGCKTVAAFSRAVAEYTNNGVKAKTIERHVRACAKRSMVKPLEVAREMIAVRTAK